MNSQISTDVYFKPTGAHQYLKFNSCHTRSIKLNIPFSHALQLCTIIDDRQIKATAFGNEGSSPARGYPAKCNDYRIERAKAILQAELGNVQMIKEDETAFVATQSCKPHTVAAWSNNLWCHENEQMAGKGTKYNKLIENKTPTIKHKGHFNTRQVYCKTNPDKSTKWGHKRWGTCLTLQEISYVTLLLLGKKKSN